MQMVRRSTVDVFSLMLNEAGPWKGGDQEDSVSSWVFLTMCLIPCYIEQSHFLLNCLLPSVSVYSQSLLLLGIENIENLSLVACFVNRTLWFSYNLRGVRVLQFPWGRHFVLFFRWRFGQHTQRWSRRKHKVFWQRRLCWKRQVIVRSYLAAVGSVLVLDWIVVQLLAPLRTLKRCQILITKNCFQMLVGVGKVPN